MLRQQISKTIVPIRKRDIFVKYTRAHPQPFIGLPAEFKCLHLQERMLIYKLHLHDIKSMR